MTYRDDREALEQRRDQLERDLRSIREKLAQNQQLEAELLGTVKDLEETYARLNAAKAPPSARRSLPLLARIHVASPCNVPWDSMVGDGRVRHCGSCDKDVYDLSAMTRADAEALLLQTEGKICAQYYRRSDGTILTADCDVGVGKKKKSRRRAAIAAVALTASAASAIGAAFALRNDDACEGSASVETRAPTALPPTEVLPTQVSESKPPRGDESYSHVRGDVAIDPPPRVTHVRGALRR
jgi:hypothetical protein